MISSNDPWLVPTPSEMESLGDRMPLSLNEKHMRAFNLCQITLSLATIMLHRTLITVPFRFQHKINSSISFQLTSLVMNPLWRPWMLKKSHGRIFIIDHPSSPTFDMWKTIYNLSSHQISPWVPKTPFWHTMCYHKIIWETLWRPIPLTSRWKKASPNTFILARIAHLKRWKPLQPYLRSFVMFFAWSYEEMSGIDPSIVINEIKTYPDAKPIRKKLWPVHPQKTKPIKEEVEKLLKNCWRSILWHTLEST